MTKEEKSRKLKAELDSGESRNDKRRKK